jgi:hypothetical protein
MRKMSCEVGKEKLAHLFGKLGGADKVGLLLAGGRGKINGAYSGRYEICDGITGSRGTEGRGWGGGFVGELFCVRFCRGSRTSKKKERRELGLGV